MQVVGVFRELTHCRSATHLPSIHDVRNGLTREASVVMARYLRDGTPLVDVMEATPDPFDSAIFINGGPSLLSDGTWVWREDLAHYVECYLVGLPDEFVEHARAAQGESRNEAKIAARWREALVAYERAEAGVR